MICPYRKVTKTFTATDNSQVIAEEYATCYEKLCPWHWRSNIGDDEGCNKVDTDYFNCGGKR